MKPIKNAPTRVRASAIVRFALTYCFRNRLKRRPFLLSPRLERVPHGNLHDPRSPLNVGKVGEVARRLIQIRIQWNAEPAAAGVERAHLLRIGHVEDLPAELQFVTLRNPGRNPAEVECLAESHVDNDVSGHPENVAFAGLTGIGIPKVLESEDRITAEELRRSHRIPGWTCVEVSCPDCIALNVPVGSPARVVKHAGGSVVEANRHAGIESEDARELPTADEAIGQFASV